MKSLTKLALCLTLLSTTANAATNDLPPPMPSKRFYSEVTVTKVAVGSCFAPQLEEDRIFNTIKSTKPDVFLFIGDNVYQSKETHDMHLPYLKEGYGLLAKSQTFAALRKTTPVLPTWDDHDFGMNDAGSTYKPKYNAEKLFEHVWAFDEFHDASKRTGVYYSKLAGPKGKRLQIIMLDTRFFRSDLIKAAEDHPKKIKFLPHTERNTTILGQTQWQWLEQQLAVPADLRLLVSSVQLLSGEGFSEGWYLFPHEQQRLLNLLANRNDVIVLSGDRHYSNYYQIERPEQPPLVEFTASSLNLPITGKYRKHVEKTPEPYQSGPPVMDSNFGLLEIDWSTKQVTMTFIDDKGKRQRTRQVGFD